MDAILHFAESHGMQIVRTYSDSGKSGLTLAGRAGLKQLLRDVQSGQANYRAILVYDVSRWGRFQDVDESAHYEFICKLADIKVHYCAEQFQNDDNPLSMLLKTMKRTMAGEFSRELSVKTFTSQCRITKLGFRTGGIAGIGLRRLLIDRDGQPKVVLDQGEEKNIRTDRIILVPGPPKEIKIVREIYHLFVQKQMSQTAIAELLNKRGVLNSIGRVWTCKGIGDILENPKYAGDNVYFRTSCKLRTKQVANPPELWVARADAFEAIVDKGTFLQAQNIIQERRRRLNDIRKVSDEELIQRLRNLLSTRGKLSCKVIEAAEDLPNYDLLRRRFGSITRCYNLIAYRSEQCLDFHTQDGPLRQLWEREIERVIERLKQEGAKVERPRHPNSHLLIINEEFRVYFVLVRCNEKTGDPKWLVHFRKEYNNPDLLLVARLSAGNREILDYYLLPFSRKRAKVTLSIRNSMLWDTFRFENLNFFLGMARRARLLEAT